jgi:magnesium chelatase subunit H
VTHAGLYRGLSDLQESLNRFRSLGPGEQEERQVLAGLIRSQAIELELLNADDNLDEDLEDRVTTLNESLAELRDALIPQGLHVVGEPTPAEERRDLLRAIAKNAAAGADDVAIEAMVTAAIEGGNYPSDCFEQLVKVNTMLSQDHELDAIIHGLDGGYIAPVTGGDLMRSADILPTGRNIHGFDPMRLPSAFACRCGAAQADQLLQRHLADTGAIPESIALVLWGSDNLKTEGGPIGQALHLLGAAPRFDTYGRLAGASLIPLEELGRPRVDVLMTLSGIFRDLLPMQTRMLAEAAWLAANADEPLAMNFVRKHVLEYRREFDCDLETAALRVYSNSVGAYGSSVNYVIEAGTWNDDSEIANQYSQRKCCAYGRDGNATKHEALFERSLKDVSATFQNLESAELGITSINHYFDTLGGISKAVERAKGESVEVYIGDQTGDSAKIRTLGEQVALEARSRMLNPRWYEGLIEHGYEGVKQIESHVTNTMGWSATTGRVAPWIYQEISQTFVLDKEMRERLAALNPIACAKVAGRLLEASDRNFWAPDAATLAALEQAGEELDDRLEGIGEVAA